MGLSQDEIDRMMGENQAGNNKIKEPGKTVIKKISTLMAGAIENIIPVLISSTGEMKVSAGEPVQKQLDELLNSLPENNTYFVFSEQSLTSVTFIGYIDLKMALDISQKMMGQKGSEEINEALLSALNEAFNNVLGAYDTALKEEFGFEVEHGDLKFLEGAPAEAVPAGSGYATDAKMFHFPISGTVNGDSFKSGLIISESGIDEITGKHPETVAAREAAESQAEETEAEIADIQDDTDQLIGDSPERQKPAQQVAKVTFEGLTPGQSIGEQKGIDLILDVPLGVTVELGRKTLSVREILGLNPGSLVELEKLAGEAVDLLVNGKLFAKGEVVVIDENFGVRVSTIVTPKERIERMTGGH